MDYANGNSLHAKGSVPSDQGDFLQTAKGYGRLLLRELRRRGFEPREELAALGFGGPEHGEGSRFMSPAQFADFLRLVDERAGDAVLGLHAGARIQIHDLGLLGLLLRCSPDGWSAHAYYERFRDATPHFADLEVAVDDSEVVFRRAPSSLPPSPILSECFLARTLTMVRELFGAVEPLEVWLAHDQPSDMQEHSRILGDRLRFDQAEDALVFPSELLARALPRADPTAADILACYLARESAGNAGFSDLAGRVRAAIREELGRGRATTRKVASRLQLSERTMRRHLSMRGARFQYLLDEVRRDLVLRYLRESTYTSAELSVRLGFNGPAAFCRAFRRWTGTSLTKYRAQHAPVEPLGARRGASSSDSLHADAAADR